MVQDFKKFVLRGNVIDLAVAVIIGGAFGKIVSSFVNDIVMPLIGVILGGVDFKTLRWVIKPAVDETPEVAMLYGQFIQNIVDFAIIAFVIFMMIRIIEKARKKPQPEAVAIPAEPPADVKLLTEIRDLLKRQ
ncbi:MAG: Large-conductance mechanosensitive channel [Clostridiales bacterium 38_11]|nr:MAG: Large-conductance mechanosensitive channel [Clostridiales bacterium 38_11]HBH12568.1 large conductance mechanosensitive channel protein MscL [Clostridiales bacterium]